MRVRKWPKPRGRPRNEKEAYWQEWFREANLCAKYSPPEDQIAAREATKDTPWNIRDLQIKAMRGRMWSFVTPEGRKIYSMAQYEDASEGLDIISQYPGSMLVRGNEYWEYLVPGPAGYVLTSQGENMKPVWAPVSAVGGGSNYKAPLLADFPTWVNQGSAVAEQAPEGPLVISSETVSTTPNIVLRVKPYKGPLFAYIVGLDLITSRSSGKSAGLFLRNSSSGEILRFNLRYDGTYNCASVSIDHYTSETGTATTISRVRYGIFSRLFLRLVDDGNNLAFDISADNASYINRLTIGRNSYISNIDQIGLGIVNGGGTGHIVSASFFHYEEKAI